MIIKELHNNNTQAVSPKSTSQAMSHLLSEEFEMDVDPINGSGEHNNETPLPDLGLIPSHIPLRRHPLIMTPAEDMGAHVDPTDDGHSGISGVGPETCSKASPVPHHLPEENEADEQSPDTRAENYDDQIQIRNQSLPGFRYRFAEGNTSFNEAYEDGRPNDFGREANHGHEPPFHSMAQGSGRVNGSTSPSFGQDSHGDSHEIKKVLGHFYMLGQLLTTDYEQNEPLTFDDLKEALNIFGQRLGEHLDKAFEAMQSRVDISKPELFNGKEMKRSSFPNRRPIEKNELAVRPFRLMQSLV